MTGDGTGPNRESADGGGSDGPGTEERGVDPDAPADESDLQKNEYSSVWNRYDTENNNNEDIDGSERPAAGDGGSGPPSGDSGSVAAAVRWFLYTDDDPAAFVREFARSAAIVLLIGALLFAVSGVWPPMVAVESPSMEPHMQPGDLVFLMEEGRFPPEAAHADTGVVTRQAATPADYRRFNDYGDVIVFTTEQRIRRGQPPIIHRAQFWVEEGENWYDRADTDHVTGGSCAAIRHCPAPHAGFITRGDANAYYDQVQGLSPPVRPEDIRGTAEVRVPLLGCVRLYFEGTVPGTCRL